MMESLQNCRTPILNPDDPGLSKDKLVWSDQVCCHVLSKPFSEIYKPFKKEAEEEEKHKQTAGNPSSSLDSLGQYKTLPYVSGRNSLSAKQTSLKNEIKLFKERNSIALEDKWFKKWINCLKAKEITTAPNQQDTKPQKEVEEPKEEELEALRFICNTSINLISNSRKKSRPKKLQHKVGVESAVSEKSNPTGLVQQGNRLNLQEPKAPMRKMAGIKAQNSAHSSDYNKRELKQVSFQKKEKGFLDSTRTKEKIEEYKYIKDILRLIGEIHTKLPRLSDDPEKIWERFNAPIYTR